MKWINYLRKKKILIVSLHFLLRTVYINTSTTKHIAFHTIFYRWFFSICTAVYFSRLEFPEKSHELLLSISSLHSFNFSVANFILQSSVVLVLKSSDSTYES